MKPEVEFMVGPFLDGEVKLCLLAKPKCKLHYYLQVADEMIHQCRRKRRYKKKKKKQFSESFHNSCLSCDLLRLDLQVVKR